MSVDEFIDEQGFKTVGVLVGGPKRQNRDERLRPLNFLLFVGYNRDFPGKPGLLFAVMRFISGIHLEYGQNDPFSAEHCPTYLLWTIIGQPWKPCVRR
jgi:hypothetical protein